MSLVFEIINSFDRLKVNFSVEYNEDCVYISTKNTNFKLWDEYVCIIRGDCLTILEKPTIRLYNTKELRFEDKNHAVSFNVSGIPTELKYESL